MALFTDIPCLSSSHLCPVESQVPLAERVQRQASALLLQTLWRGYSVRKTLAEKTFGPELAAAEPLWASLDEAYRLCIVCQNYAVVLNHSNDEWDATESPWYIWMLTQGRYLDNLEIYMMKRGWRRPEVQPLEDKKAFRAMKEVLRYYKPAPAPTLCLMSQLGLFN